MFNSALFLKASTLLTAVCILTACGFKGDLYLPDATATPPASGNVIHAQP